MNSLVLKANELLKNGGRKMPLVGNFRMHENNNTYEPFVKYYFGILIKASNEFESRVEYLSSGKINKKEILEKCPDISTKTVERALADLVKEGLIEKVGASSATSYVWIQK